jgi:archaellin
LGYAIFSHMCRIWDSVIGLLHDGVKYNMVYLLPVNLLVKQSPMSRVRKGSVVELILHNKESIVAKTKYVHIRGRAGVSQVQGESVHTTVNNVTASFAMLNSKSDGFTVSNANADDTPESKLWDGVFAMSAKNEMVFIADADGDLNAPRSPVMQAWHLELQKPHREGPVWRAKTTRSKQKRTLHVGPRGGRFIIVRGRKVYQ